jgi:hypothetical protein
MLLCSNVARVVSFRMDVGLIAPTGRAVPGLNLAPTQLAGMLCSKGSVEKVGIVGVVEKFELWNTASKRLPGCMPVAVGEATE